MLPSDLELAPSASVVTTCTESEIEPSPLNILTDSSITFTVQRAAIAKVGTAREDQ